MRSRPCPRSLGGRACPPVPPCRYPPTPPRRDGNRLVYGFFLPAAEFLRHLNGTGPSVHSGSEPNVSELSEPLGRYREPVSSEPTRASRRDRDNCPGCPVRLRRHGTGRC